MGRAHRGSRRRPAVTPRRTPSHDHNPTTDRVEQIAVDLIDPDPDNRPAVLDDAFQASVAQHGVLMPILVTPTDDGRYRLVAGERRYRAAVTARQATIPASIRTADASTAAVWQAVENLARVDLTPSQEARQTARIMAAGMKQKALAAALNRPLSWVRARLAIVGLPTAVQDAIDAGTYEPSDALTFAKYADRPDVIDAVLADNYRSGSDLDWRLQRAAEAARRRRVPPSDARPVRPRRVGRVRGLRPDRHPPRRQAAQPSSASTTPTTPASPATSSSSPAAATSGPTWRRGAPTPAATSPRARATSRWPTTTPEPTPPTTTAPRRARSQARRQGGPTHRDDFARQAIAAKLRGRDLTDFVLPVLFDVAGQTELTAAGKLLGLDRTPRLQGGGKDYATPLREWAGQSTANLTRAMLAIAYGHATIDPTYASDTWRQTSRQAVTGWLDGLGYQPEP